MTERTEVCLQKSVCVEKCLEDRRWSAGNIQASLPCILLQTSISHWFDFILKVRTALLIAANSCNSVVIPNIQSSFFPNKDNFWSSVKWDDDTIPETSWAEVMLFQSRYKQFISGASSKPTPVHVLRTASLTAPDPSPACLVRLCSVLGEMWWGAARAWDMACWSLHRAQQTLQAGQRAGL